jgi:hypothetical protein
MSNYPEIPFDVNGHVRRVRPAPGARSCFICSIIARTSDDHLVIFDASMLVGRPGLPD